MKSSGNNIKDEPGTGPVTDPKPEPDNAKEEEKYDESSDKEKVVIFGHGIKIIL